jgi:hypothetical protein
MCHLKISRVEVVRIAESFTGLATFRSLDAIHVASAALLQNSTDGIITYDLHMTRNAKKLGLGKHLEG